MYLIYRHAVFFLGLLFGQKKAIAFAQLWGPGVSWKHQKRRNRKQNNKSKPQQQSRLSFYHYPCATSCPELTKTWFRKPLNTLPQPYQNWYSPPRNDDSTNAILLSVIRSRILKYVLIFWHMKKNLLTNHSSSIYALTDANVTSVSKCCDLALRTGSIRRFQRYATTYGRFQLSSEVPEDFWIWDNLILKPLVTLRAYTTAKSWI